MSTPGTDQPSGSGPTDSSRTHDYPAAASAYVEEVVVNGVYDVVVDRSSQAAQTA